MYYKRLPRKIKKGLKRRGIIWQDYRDENNREHLVGKHLDVIFDRNYEEPYKIFNDIIK